MQDSKILSVGLLILLLIAGTKSVAAQQPQKLLELEELNCECELAGLDYIANQLMTEQSSIGYIVIYGGRQNITTDEIRVRGARMKRYLTENLGISKERLVVIEGGYRERLSIEFWLGSRDTGRPTITPTVDARDVIFLKGRALRWEEPGCTPG
jgi:hypothetical protein